VNEHLDKLASFVSEFELRIYLRLFNIKTTAFWDMATSSLEEEDRRFIISDNGGSKHL
jgi:hypothetical protein